MPSDLTARIASDLSIPTYQGESQAQYDSRVLYSALRCWIEAACIDDGEDGRVGVSKQRITRRVGHLLDLALETAPDARQWFTGNEGKLQIKAAYDTLLDIDDLVQVSETGNVACTKKRNQGVTKDTSLVTGFFDRSLSQGAHAGRDGVGITSGLATILVKRGPDFLLSGMTPYEVVASLRDCFQWDRMRDAEPLEAPNPTCRSWSIWKAPASNALSSLFARNGLVAMRTPDDGKVGRRSYLAVMRGSGIEVACVPSDFTQTVFLYQKKLSGHPATFGVVDLGNRYLRLSGILRILPAEGQRLIRAIAWPDRNMSDTERFVVRSEALPIIEAALTRSCVEIRGY